VEIGVYTFAELRGDITSEQRVGDLIEEIELADEVGSPQEVVEKILFHHEHFGHERFLMQTSVGDLPHANALRSIELLGTEVAPAVRAAT